MRTPSEGEDGGRMKQSGSNVKDYNQFIGHKTRSRSDRLRAPSAAVSRTSLAGKATIRTQSHNAKVQTRPGVPDLRSRDAPAGPGHERRPSREQQTADPPGRTASPRPRRKRRNTLPRFFDGTPTKVPYRRCDPAMSAARLCGAAFATRVRAAEGEVRCVQKRNEVAVRRPASRCHVSRLSGGDDADS